MKSRRSVQKMKDEQQRTPEPIVISGRLLVRNTLYNFIGRAAPLLVGIITIPLIIRGLGLDRFGLLSLAWTVLSYFSIFDLGLGRATTKFVAEALGKKELIMIPHIVFSAVSVELIFGLLGAVMFCGITPFLVERVLNIPTILQAEAKQTFYILAFSIPIVFISSSFMGIFAAFQRFDLLNLIRIPSLSFIFIMPLVGLYLDYNLPKIMVLLLISRVAVLIAYFAISIKFIDFLNVKKRLIKKTFKRLLAFGGWVTISNIISPILVNIDRFIIGSILTLSAVGYYTAPSEMITRLSLISSSLVMTIFPAFSFIGELDKERLAILYTRTIKYLLLALGFIVILMILFADKILKIWLGRDFVVQSILVFQILAIGVLINSIARVPSSLLQGLGRPDITAKFHLLELPIHLLALWFFVRKFGIAGAAIAWTLRVTLDACLLFWGCSVLKIVPISIVNRTRTLKNCLIFLFIGVNVVVVFMLGREFISQSIYAISFVSIFSLIAWRYALNLVEKRVLIATLRDFIIFWKNKKYQSGNSAS
jgi:O-antigen/teichoic acid export membrane protein